MSNYFVISLNIIISKRLYVSKIDNYSSFFPGSFALRLKKLLRKSKNVSNRIPTRYDFLSCRNHRSGVSARKSVQRKNKKIKHNTLKI